MSMSLLVALQSSGSAKICGISKEFTFQHKLCHDFESLIWVMVYAMMVRRKSILAATDSNVHAAYKAQLDLFWGAHSYPKLLSCHGASITAASMRPNDTVDHLLFPDVLEAKFFRAAMRVVRDQAFDAEPITYKKMQDLFRTYIQAAEQANYSTLAPA